MIASELGIKIFNRTIELYLERVNRTRSAYAYLEHAAEGAVRALAGREPSHTTIEKIAGLLSINALDQVLMAAALPSKGAIRDRGALSGLSAVREVVSRG